MTDPEGSDLEQRVARLERLVADLAAGGPSAERAARDAGESRGSPSGASTGSGSGASASSRSGAPASSGSASSASRGSGPRAGDDGGARFAWAQTGGPARSSPEEALIGESEKWLARVGIGFVVLAFGFLLKLSFDRGWITPAVRVASGFATAVALLFVGLRLEAERRRLSQAMVGGAIALLYLSTYAGHQLYGLLPFWLALSLMTTTTVLAIVLSDRRQSPALSVIGVLGGLATPFLLEAVSRDPSMLSVYCSLVLLGGAAIHFSNGWLSLQWTLTVAGSFVLVGVVLSAGDDRLLLPSLAIGVYALCTVAVSLARPVLRGEESSESTPVPPKHRASVLLWSHRLTGAWATAATVIAVALLFDLGRVGTGVVLLGLGALLAAAAWSARGTRLTGLVASELAAVSVALGFMLVRWDSVGVLLVMSEVVALKMLVSNGSPPTLGKIADALAAAACFGFLLLAQYAQPGASLGFREGAFARVGVLVLLTLAGSWSNDEGAVYYRSAAYVGALVWLLSELGIREHGRALVSIAWSVQGAVTLLVAITRGERRLKLAGLGTLALVALKLLFVDLATLDPIWRVALFLGFGATLLGLGYAINRPSRSTPQEGGPSARS